MDFPPAKMRPGPKGSGKRYSCKFANRGAMALSAPHDYCSPLKTVQVKDCMWIFTSRTVMHATSHGHISVLRQRALATCKT